VHSTTDPWSQARLSRARTGAKGIRSGAHERYARLAATVESPPDPTTSPWLAIAAPVGRIATYFLIGAAFLQLFAPLVFLAELSSQADPAGPGGSLVLLLSDPGRLLSIADLVSLVGIVILACALFLILFGLVRADKKVGIDTFLLGVVVFACLVTWVPVMLVSQGIARGTVTSVNAAAATGGWGLASLLLLGASLAYLFFAIRLENGTKARKLASFKWPVYAAVNVLGSAAIAGYVAGGNLDAFSLGLVLKVTIIPLLAVMAYSDLRDRFPAWALVPLMKAPPTVEVVRPVAVARRTVLPPSLSEPRPQPPPPPMGVFAQPLPPPPDD